MILAKPTESQIVSTSNDDILQLKLLLKEKEHELSRKYFGN